MASIDSASLTSATEHAVQITTSQPEGYADPPAIIPSSGAEGAGAAVVIVHSTADTLDIKGQLAARGWRTVCVSQITPDSTPQVIVEWRRRFEA